MTPEDRLRHLDITLPVAPPPAANYIPFVHAAGMLHISGQIPFDADGKLIRGRLGETMSVVEGAAAARRCAIGVIAQLKAALGELGRVTHIVKLNIFVNSAADFTDQPEVGNGASDLMVEVFGEAGRHARSAVGVAALPRGVAVEVDAVVAVH